MDPLIIALIAIVVAIVAGLYFATRKRPAPQIEGEEPPAQLPAQKPKEPVAAARTAEPAPPAQKAAPPPPPAKKPEPEKQKPAEPSKTAPAAKPAEAAPAQKPEAPPPPPAAQRAAEPEKPKAPPPAPPAQKTAEPARRKDIEGLRKGLTKVREKEGFFGRLKALFSGKKEIDPNIVEQIEEVLLTSDVGVATTEKLLAEIKERLKKNELKDEERVWELLREHATALLAIGGGGITLFPARRAAGPAWAGVGRRLHPARHLAGAHGSHAMRG